MGNQPTGRGIMEQRIRNEDAFREGFPKHKTQKDLLGCSVDVVTKTSLSPYIREGIVKEAVCMGSNTTKSSKV